MAKNIQNQEEVMVAEAVTKTEQFFEEHGKKVVIALVALLVLFSGAYAYKYLVVDKNENAAKALIAKAQENISGETPNFELALKGDESNAGFLEVIEQYGSTDAGNIANHPEPFLSTFNSLLSIIACTSANDKLTLFL